MTPAWAQRQKELLSDCVVSPDVFHHMRGQIPGKKNLSLMLGFRRLRSGGGTRWHHRL